MKQDMYDVAQPVSEPERVRPELVVKLELKPPQLAWPGKAAQLRKGPRLGRPQHHLEDGDENRGAHSVLDQES